ncbi:hypothetical protein ABZ318_03610 [Streptomyces sp. NPDC006197]|uniref:hypothetical protein n=1 Tax=Streptomyces sp. NPDC006197 TaxID=3156685 RepID=UPI0033B8645A
MGDTLVQPSDVTDRRERRLLIPPASLVEDVLGTDLAEYRRGGGRPPVSLREAINALMRGELPTTPETPVAVSPAPQEMSRAFLADGSGGLTAVWSGKQSGGSDQIFASRMDLANGHGGFAAPQQISSGGTHVNPHAVLLPDGPLLVAYQAGAVGAADVVMKRAPLGGLASAAEIPVAATPGVDETSPFLTVTGDLTTVFFYRSTTRRWYYRRWKNTTNAWKDPEGRELSAIINDSFKHEFHAAVDPDGKVWAAFPSHEGLTILRFDPETGDVTYPGHVGVHTGYRTPFVLCTRTGVVWVFWSTEVTGSALWACVLQSGSCEILDILDIVDDHELPYEPTEYGHSPNRFNPHAVEDEDGAIWLFWAVGDEDGTGSFTSDLAVMRSNPVNGKWGATRQLDTSPVHSTPYLANPYPNVAFTVVASGKANWIFWAADHNGVTNIYHKRLLFAV